MLGTIIATAITARVAYSVVKEVKHRKLIQDFNDWMKNDFEKVWNETEKKTCEWMESDAGKAMLEILDKDVES